MERLNLGAIYNTNDAATYQRISLDYIEYKLWCNIRKAAETNETLQEALERVKILYYLSINDGNKEG